MKRKFLCFLVLVMMLFTSTVVPVSGASTVDTKINEIKAAYPDGSFFTVNGKSCTHDKGKEKCNNCRLGSIVSSRHSQYASSFSGAAGNRWTCMAFASFAFYHIWGHDWRTNTTVVPVSSAQKGDFVVFGPNSEGGYHYGIFISSGVVMDGNGYNPATVGEVKHSNPYPFKNFSKITVYRSAKGTPAEPDYVNLGDKFNASIFRKDHNVTFLSDTATLGTGGRHARSVWTFERQSNGAYIISSMYDGKVLDVYDAGKTDGTKVWTYAKWADSSGHNPAQEWYIYANAAADGGGYRFVPRVAPNKCMTCNQDSYGPKTGMNLQAYVKRASQTFTIYKQTEIFPTGISTSNVTVKAGETAKVPYTISPSNTNSKYVGATFSSSDTSVVTVASDGTITGVNPGTAYITVTMSFNERKSAKSKITVEAAQCGHSWDDGVVTQEPTCIDRGVIEYTCQLCGETTYETIDVTMHAYGDYDVVTKAGFGEEGVMAAVCTAEGCDSTIEQVIPALETPVLSKTAYTFNGKSKKPTVTVTNTEGDTVSKTVRYASGRTNAGKYAVKVTVDTESYEDTATVYFKINPAKITKATLSAGSYTYNGKAKKPTVTVKAGTLTPASKIAKDTAKIDLTYASGRKLVGTYKVTVKGKGNYTGTITKTFKINPSKTYITSLKAGNNKFTVKLKKKTTQVTGYQVRYSTSSKFSSYTTKTISSNKTVSKTYTGLKDKKTYYVKVRTYKKVNGTPYYSGWSTVKKIRTK